LISCRDDGIVVVGEVGQEYVVESYKRSHKRSRARHVTMTVAEYLRTPETVLPQELIFGTLRVADAPLPRHQRAVGHLFLALHEHVSQLVLGEVWLSPIDVILDTSRHLVVQPDLLFISNERSHILTDRIRGGPDLVVEVLSPNPRIGRIDEHVDWYAEYGVGECWLVDLFARRVDVLALGRSGVSSRQAFDQSTPVSSRVLPQFSRTLGGILGF
jgi:Uma2 family endonuclease